MGATCVKGKSATLKHAGEGGGANAAGRPQQCATRDNAPASERGNRDGVQNKNNNNNERPAGGGGGIGAYKPSSDVAKTYFHHIKDLRNVAMATGVLRAVGGGGGVDSTRGDGTSLTGTRRSSPYSTTACPPLRTLTVYQCQPLMGDTVVAKGMYGSVHLARLSVFTVASDAAVSATVPRHLARRRTNDMSSIFFSPDPASMDGSDSASLSLLSASARNSDSLNSTRNANAGGSVAHYVIAMKELLMYASYSSNVLLEQICTEVRNWTRLSASTSRVLRCYTLEYVYSGNVSTAVPEACCHFYCSLPMEESKSLRTGTPSPSSSPIGKVLELRRTPSGSTSPNLLGNLGKNSKSRSVEAIRSEVSGTPQTLRLYLEYAKYGTLRGYQSREIPEKFNRRRLHELTARAYMRDVLLALLQLHECGELQYDLCAKSIFLNRPIHTVYGTYFPAYISDVPSGDLTGVTPTQLGKALRLLDPLVSQPSSSSSNNNVGSSAGMPAWKAKRYPHTTGNEPIIEAVQVDGKGAVNGVVGSLSGQLTAALDSAVYNALGNASVMTQAASNVPPVSLSEPKINDDMSTDTLHHTGYRQRDTVGGGGDNARKARKPSPDEISSSSSTVTSLHADYSIRSRKKQDRKPRAAGKQASLNRLSTGRRVEGDVVADRQRLNETYCRYMNKFEFKSADDDKVPFPPSHDGIQAQADAELIATTMLPEELRAMPATWVAPLQRSGLGGVAITSPDPFVMKPGGDALNAPDLRGRLPMMLSPSTRTSALVCGSPHMTPLVFSVVPASQGHPSTPGPAPLTCTMSSGTSMANAAGSLGRARGGVPLTKLNHASLIRRALAYGDAERLEDVPLYRYITVTHAAPEVLRRRTFSPASDIYAFAMTFIELVTDDGAVMEDCLPQNLPKPQTRREKEAYDVQLTANLDAWYQKRLTSLRQNFDAAEKEQQLPAVLSPRAGPTVVRIPEHLSDEARNMLRWCLQSDPRKRPTAVELLRSRYFVLGDWIAAPTVLAAERGAAKPPEKPWDASVDFDASARAIGLPRLQK